MKYLLAFIAIAMMASLAAADMSFGPIDDDDIALYPNTTKVASGSSGQYYYADLTLSGNCLYNSTPYTVVCLMLVGVGSPAPVYGTVCIDSRVGTGELSESVTNIMVPASTKLNLVIYLDQTFNATGNIVNIEGSCHFH